MKVLMVTTSHDQLGNTGRKTARPLHERARAKNPGWCCASCSQRAVGYELSMRELQHVDPTTI